MIDDNKSLEKERILSERTVVTINQIKPKFVIICGDLTNARPSEPAGKNYIPQVEAFKEIFSKIDKDIPLVCVCGNHDIGETPTIYDVNAYTSKFGDDYFSFWVGGCFCLVLNSTFYCRPGEVQELHKEQEAWLDNQLNLASKDSDIAHIFVFMHHPLFLSKPDEDEYYYSKHSPINLPLPIRGRLIDKFKQAKVKAVFAGHYHRNAQGFAEDLEMITTSALGMPLGADPSGFRIVKVHKDKIEHHYYAVDRVITPEDLKF